MCPATPGANAHGAPRTAVTSANGAPSRPAGRVQPCRFDLLPPCTPITARQRTPRPDWASRAARIGPLPGDQATVPPQDGARRDQPVRPQPSRQEPDQRGQHRPVGPVPPGPGQVRRSTATSCRRTSSSASSNAGERPSRTSQPAIRTKSDRADATTRPVIMPSSHAAPIAPGHSHRPASGTPQARCGWWRTPRPSRAPSRTRRPRDRFAADGRAKDDGHDGHEVHGHRRTSRSDSCGEGGERGRGSQASRGGHREQARPGRR